MELGDYLRALRRGWLIVLGCVIAGAIGGVVTTLLADQRPITREPLIYVAFGVLVGLAMGVAIAVIRAVLDPRIRGPRDIELITEVPVIGGLARDLGSTVEWRASIDGPQAEPLRALCRGLEFLSIGGPSRIYVLSSATPGEGASLTTVLLAGSLAASGARVAIVDGDFRRPRIAELMKIEGGSGLAEVLVGQAKLTDALVSTVQPNLSVLPAGAVPSSPGPLLRADTLHRVLADLASTHDYVLVDAPPLLWFADAASLSIASDGVLLVSAAGVTRKSELRSVTQMLQSIGSRVVGVILTRVPSRGPDSLPRSRDYAA